jgi:hypothetical protein
MIAEKTVTWHISGRKEVCRPNSNVIPAKLALAQAGGGKKYVSVKKLIKSI